MHGATGRTQETRQRKCRAPPLTLLHWPSDRRPPHTPWRERKRERTTPRRPTKVHSALIDCMEPQSWRSIVRKTSPRIRIRRAGGWRICNWSRTITAQRAPHPSDSRTQANTKAFLPTAVPSQGDASTQGLTTTKGFSKYQTSSKHAQARRANKEWQALECKCQPVSLDLIVGSSVREPWIRHLAADPSANKSWAHAPPLLLPGVGRQWKRGVSDRPCPPPIERLPHTARLPTAATQPRTR